MKKTNKPRIIIVLATSAAVLGAGVAAWAQQLEVKKDTWLATSSGDVGVGTTTPGQKLDVVGGKIRSDTGFCIGSNCITAWGSSASNPGGWTLSGSNIYYSSGLVGIGTASPTESLDVRGNVCEGGADFILGQYDGRTQGSKTRNRALVHASWGNMAGTPTDTLYLDYNGDFEGGVHVSGPGLMVDGKIGIGTTSPNYRLEVNGTAAGTSWTNLSSRSYKQQIRRVSKAEQRRMLDTLMRMKPSRYQYKPQYGGDGAEHIGFIAEEMPKEVLSKNGKGVDVYELQTLTIAALKAAESQIAAQRSEIAAQRGQMAMQQRELVNQERQIKQLLSASHESPGASR